MAPRITKDRLERDYKQLSHALKDFEHGNATLGEWEADLVITSIKERLAELSLQLRRLGNA